MPIAETSQYIPIVSKRQVFSEYKIQFVVEKEGTTLRAGFDTSYAYPASGDDIVQIYLNSESIGRWVFNKNNRALPKKVEFPISVGTHTIMFTIVSPDTRHYILAGVTLIEPISKETTPPKPKPFCQFGMVLIIIMSLLSFLSF